MFSGACPYIFCGDLRIALSLMNMCSQHDPFRIDHRIMGPENNTIVDDSTTANMTWDL